MLSASLTTSIVGGVFLLPSLVFASEAPRSPDQTIDEANPVVELTSVSQLSDVKSSDWAFQALQSLAERYGCIAGYADAKYRGDRALTRYEFAAGLNACLTRINALTREGTANLATSEDLTALQRLQSEFATELSALRGRADALEVQTGQLEAQQFSTTTKLSGEVIFAGSGVFGGEKAVRPGLTAGSREKIDGNVIFSNRVRLSLNTSFTGQDLLRIRLQASNTPSFGKATGTNMARLGFDSDTENKLILNHFLYRFPIGSSAVTAIASGTLFDVADTINPFLGSDSQGSISAFGVRSPIYREEIGGSGVGFSYNFSSAVNLALVYLTSDASKPTSGSGLFGGPFSALAQLTIKPTNSFRIGLAYARSFNSIDIGTSSAIANDPFNGASKSVVGNSYSLAASWQVDPAVSIGG